MSKLELINFYTHPKTKQFMVNCEDTTYEPIVNMKLNQHMLFIGGTGSGKTSVLVNLIYHTPNTFQHIWIATKINEPLYNMLQAKLTEQMLTICYDVIDIPDPSTFPDISPKDKCPPHYLIIIDDFLQDLSGGKLGVQRTNILKKYLNLSRKKNCTVALLAQNYFSVPKPMRSNISYIIMRSIASDKDLRLITSQYPTFNVTPANVYNMFKFATDNGFPNFFMIECNQQDPMKKYRKNFDEFLNPNQFKTSSVPEPINEPSPANDYILQQLQEDEQKPKKKRGRPRKVTYNVDSDEDN
jgi:hypothetical protein